LFCTRHRQAVSTLGKASFCMRLHFHFGSF
jgi:hypothetical protein